MNDQPGFNLYSNETTKPAPVVSTRLRPADKLADRFVIVQFLARGGMGEVYEAEDLHLQGKHHALKTLRSEIADNPIARQRFEREVLLAREVHHPNVCPTYDLFHIQHEGKPLTFLTMKLLRGEPLLTRMQRVNRFDAEAVLPIAKQMANALDAAHRRGVIHRDFKPGNVMLEDTGSAVSVSITDFGLSKALEGDTTLAETGLILGTPGYIAPELIQGQLPSFASDVYAFGVVLFEMLTGTKPMRDDATGKTIAPSQVASSIPIVWDNITLGCLETDPVKRFRSAGDALSLLEASPHDAATDPDQIPKRSWLKQFGVGMVAALLLLAVWFSMPRINRALHPLPQKRFVAIMMWPSPETSLYRPLLRSTLETIESRFSRSESVTHNLVVLPTADLTGQPALTQPVDAAHILGANLVLAIAMQTESAGVTVVLSVVDASTNKILRSRSFHVQSVDVSSIPDRASLETAELLDAPGAGEPLKDQDELASVPADAFQMFTAAEDLAAKSNSSELDEAIEKYQRAVDAHPRFALAYARLSMAYREKYGKFPDPALLTLAERNADLALRLNKDSAKALLARAMVDVTAGNLPLALEELKHVGELDPENPDVIMTKGRAYRALDRPQEEEAVYRDLMRNLPNFWPVYLELGLNLRRQGKTRESMGIFAQGVAVAPGVVRLLNNLGALQITLGMKKEAEDTYRRSLNASPTDTAYLNVGTLRFEAKDYRRALNAYEKAAEINPKNEAVWRNLGDCYFMLGDSAQVANSYEKAAAVVSDILKVNPKRGPSWMNLAFYEAKLSHRNESESALRNAETNGATDLPSQFKKVQVLALLGRKDEAVTLLVDCRKQGLAAADVDLALDLQEVRSDPRYLKAVEEFKTKAKS
jgi:eukaryotic-like serine/threonine-protein kinase